MNEEERNPMDYSNDSDEDLDDPNEYEAGDEEEGGEEAEATEATDAPEAEEPQAYAATGSNYRLPTMPEDWTPEQLQAANDRIMNGEIVGVMLDIANHQQRRADAQRRAALLVETEAQRQYGGVVNDGVYGKLFREAYANLSPEIAATPGSGEIALLAAVGTRGQQIGMGKAFEEAARLLNGRKPTESASPPPKPLNPSQRVPSPTTGGQPARREPARGGTALERMTRDFGIQKRQAEDFSQELAPRRGRR